MELLKIANCFDNSVFNSLKKNTCRFCCMTNLFRNRERWIIIFTVHLLTGVYKFATFFIQLLLRLSWHHLSAYHNINLLSLKKMYYFSTAVSYEYRSKIKKKSLLICRCPQPRILLQPCSWSQHSPAVVWYPAYRVA